MPLSAVPWIVDRWLSDSDPTFQIRTGSFDVVCHHHERHDINTKVANPVTDLVLGFRLSLISGMMAFNHVQSIPYTTIKG